MVKTKTNDLVIERIIDAPQEKLFKAWIDSKQLEKWWGPKDFTNPICEIDPKVGGKILIDMQAPDGVIYPMEGKFTQMAGPGLLAFRSAALDDKGKPIFEVLTTATFEKQGGKTKLTVRASVLNATTAALPSLAGMNEGWNQSLDRLELLVGN